MAPLTCEQQMALKKKQAEDRPPAQDDPLDAIKQHLQGGGKILPIVGNSLVDNLIFPLSAEEGKVPRVDEFLAEFWAEKVGYPFVQRTRMAHIAQFVLMRGAAPSIAKKSYVDFLKELRLDMSETMDEEVEFVAGLRRKSGSLAFTDICAELDLTSTTDKNPLDALAEMNLPLYITTSYYDFLERALQQAGKNPLTHICFWDGPPPPEAGEHAAEREFRLGDPKKPGFRPIVYHLLGHERFPETMVLAEDDFLKYLKKIAVDSPNSQRPVIPTYLPRSDRQLRFGDDGAEYRGLGFPHALSRRVAPGHRKQAPPSLSGLATGSQQTEGIGRRSGGRGGGQGTQETGGDQSRL